jgi:hypothetical protein
MRNPATIILFLGSVAFLAEGCEQLSQQVKPTPTPKTQVVRENRVPVRRFILTRNSPDVAFDSQTGQLCRTWEWEPMAKLTAEQEATGVHPERKVGEFTPTCKVLYTQYPSGVATASEVLGDE